MAVWFQDVTNRRGSPKKELQFHNNSKSLDKEVLWQNGMLSTPRWYMVYSGLITRNVNFRSCSLRNRVYTSLQNDLQKFSFNYPIRFHAYHIIATRQLLRGLVYGALCPRFNSSRWMSRLKDDPTTRKALIKSFQYESKRYDTWESI